MQPKERFVRWGVRAEPNAAGMRVLSECLQLGSSKAGYQVRFRYEHPQRPAADDAVACGSEPEALLVYTQVTRSLERVGFRLVSAEGVLRSPISRQAYGIDDEFGVDKSLVLQRQRTAMF